MSEADNVGEQAEQRRSGDEALANSGADTMAETFMLTTIEQLRGIADPLRIRILETLITRSLTVTQLGRQLGESPAKLHYHVRELERLGMVRLVATREKEGILEKYYRAVAHDFVGPSDLLQSVPRDEFVASVSDAVNRQTQGFLRAIKQAVKQSADMPELFLLAGSSLWLKPEELRPLIDQIQALLDPYKTPRDVDGEREVALAIMVYEARLGAEQAEEMLASSVDAQTSDQRNESDTMPAQMSPRRRHVVTIGAQSFHRAELEQVIARGEQLDINVSGYCSFADDVTPDLIERAIARLRYRGVLSATPAVREALRRKEAGKQKE